MNAIQTGSEHRRSLTAPPYDQRSAAWNEEKEFAGQNVQTSQGALQTLQWCPQDKLLQTLRHREGQRLDDTYQRTGVHNWPWCVITYDGITNNKDKKTVRRSSKILDVETANCVVVSDTQAKVYIKENCAFLWVHLVFDSQSVLSLGRLCRELGYHSWTTGGTEYPKVKRMIECSIEIFVPLVAATKHKAVPSIPSWGQPWGKGRRGGHHVGTWTVHLARIRQQEATPCVLSKRNLKEYLWRLSSMRSETLW